MELVLAIIWLLGSMLCPILYWRYEGRRATTEMMQEGNIDKARDEIFFMFLFVVAWPLLVALLMFIFIFKNIEPFTKPIADKLLSWLLPS